MVDASRDLRALRAVTQKRKLQVAFAADTHLHADVLSGACQPAAGDGASVVASAAGRRESGHIGLGDGDEVDLGGLRLRALGAAEHVEELGRLAAAYLGDRSRLDTVTRDQLAQRLRAGDVVVLDVRPEPEFRAGHIAGALSIPMAELTRRLRDVPKGQQVVAYCRGPYCVYADDAVRALRRRGYQASRLEDGYPEWAQAGYP